MRNSYILILLISVLLYSCSTSKLLSDAKQSLERGEFYAATEKYKLANQKEKNPDNKSLISLGLADAYFGQGSYSQSAAWYKNAIRRGQNNIDIKLKYAEALRASEKLEDLSSLYNELENNSENPRIQNGLKSIKLIEHWGKLPPIYLIDNLKAPNSAGDEISASIIPGTSNRIFFSSSSDKSMGKNISPVTGQNFADIFIAEYDSVRSKWLFPQILEDSLKINTESHESGISVSSDGNLIIFSRAAYINGKKMIPKLYFCKRENGEWSTPAQISFTNDNASYSDPAISPNRNWLFFSSDRSGGKGETDIWKAKITNTQFSEPENMGNSINTPGKETSPFMRKNGHLYFSSNYHPGVGGLDIFHATIDLNGKWSIENMSTPINSPDDDFGITFYERGERGFFSSSRKGSRSVDLYSFYSPPRLFQCFGKVCNIENDSIIDNVNVRIVGTDGTSLLMKTEKGHFQAELKPEADYAIMVFKKGYLNAQAKISTRGLRDAFEFNLDFKQTPTDKPIKIDDINYEFGKWNLNRQAQASLDKLVEILAINPNISIEIMSHTDDIGDAAFNIELSQKRANEVVNYLIKRGVTQKRLKAKGYGESLPLKVNSRIAKQYSFLKKGNILGTKFIDQLKTSSQQEIARSLNRRTEFQVLE